LFADCFHDFTSPENDFWMQSQLSCEREGKSADIIKTVLRDEFSVVMMFVSILIKNLL